MAVVGVSVASEVGSRQSGVVSYIAFTAEMVALRPIENHARSRGPILRACVR